MQLKHLLSVVTGVVCGLLSGIVFAAGISVDEMSVRRLGDAFSGGTADATDASVVWYNPAGLTQLEKQQLTGGLIAIPHSLKFAGTVHLESGPEVNGHNKTWKGVEYIPDLYYSRPLTDQLWFGAGVNSPWGTGTDFDRTWLGRYQSVKSNLLTVNFITALAWKFDSHVSAGFGLVTEYADGIIEKAVVFSDEIEDDGFFRGTGDNISFGIIAGLYYRLSELWQFGFEYRSPIKHELEGKMKLNLSSDMASALNSPHHDNVKAKLKLKIPETWSFSTIYQLSPHWSVKADATRTNWSSFDKLVFDPRVKGTIIDMPEVQIMDWHDSWRFALGAEYQLSKQWSLRAGVAFDDSPVPNHTATIDFAVDDYRALSVGATYRYSPSLEVDIAAQHTWTSHRNIHETVLFNGVPVVQGVGEVTNRINSLGIGILWRF
ncbi:OmpP1/FadL family transporter [Sansalvadorimonas sp. 2012CJ34-2]|uniref:OmpP1/FadL family transporter n=1 Tax=Parendozoicomonas callyspongiae TaxID=2942213 RepID=A0ABT0PHQ3_9GAMM|nr:outer membrane protein transport protein [Sansalvadorimonas sp. 2012CJ34-2]MCL6270919.1 OmpP1/FadL family transporter [Sansalvadorimonas sp. 2012CJ34-2]